MVQLNLLLTHVVPRKYTGSRRPFRVTSSCQQRAGRSPLNPEKLAGTSADRVVTNYGAPCWPHEPCYLGRSGNLYTRPAVEGLVQWQLSCILHTHMYIYIYINTASLYIYKPDTKESIAIKFNSVFSVIFVGKMGQWYLTNFVKYPISSMMNAIV